MPIVKHLGVLFCLFSSVFSQAQTKNYIDQWDHVSSGRHSMQTELGDQFYVLVPVKPIDPAKVELALFDFDLAADLKLPVLSDLKKFEEDIKKRLAVEVTTPDKADRMMMATRYQDSNSKEPGEAQGDGRALWTGEIKMKVGNEDLYLDITVKGIGQTPLAWLNNPSHSDGRQSIREAVYSFIVSRANARNQLDTTRDLAVFIVKDENGKPYRSISVRVGNQTRVAHFRYHSDTPTDFKKIADYIVKRDLGLDMKTEITNAHVYEYALRYARNLGREAGRYFDLTAVHGSPTGGNRTTKGTTIDLAEFWYLDGYHKNFSFLFNQVTLGEQKKGMRDYIGNVRYYMNRAEYPARLSKNQWDVVYGTFEANYQKTVVDGTLNRLGLTASQIRLIPKGVRAQVYKVITELVELQGNETKRIAGQEIVGAAFDMRRVLARTFSTFLKTGDAVPVIFENNRTWKTDQIPDLVKAQHDYVDMIRSVANYLKGSDFKELAARAEKIGSRERLEMGDNFFKDSNFNREYVQPLVNRLEQGQNNLQENFKLIQRASDAISDPLQPLRGKTNLGVEPFLKLHPSQRSGAIDPAPSSCRLLLKSI